MLIFANNFQPPMKTQQHLISQLLWSIAVTNALARSIVMTTRTSASQRRRAVKLASVETTRSRWTESAPPWGRMYPGLVTYHPLPPPPLLVSVLYKVSSRDWHDFFLIKHIFNTKKVSILFRKEFQNLNSHLSYKNKLLIFFF